MKLFRTFSKKSPSRKMTPSFVTFVMLRAEFCSLGRKKIFSRLAAVMSKYKRTNFS